eukprot:scaffold9354_cov63-Phaeocystis_antarctica.AAC.1
MRRDGRPIHGEGPALGRARRNGMRRLRDSGTDYLHLSNHCYSMLFSNLKFPTTCRPRSQQMPRLSDPPRPTPAPKKRATSAADDDTQNAENNSQQTDRSAAKSQKTSAHSKTVSRVEAKPGVVLSVKMINFKNHSHTFQ